MAVIFTFAHQSVYILSSGVMANLTLKIAGTHESRSVMILSYNASFPGNNDAAQSHADQETQNVSHRTARQGVLRAVGQAIRLARLSRHGHRTTQFARRGRRRNLCGESEQGPARNHPRARWPSESEPGGLGAKWAIGVRDVRSESNMGCRTERDAVEKRDGRKEAPEQRCGAFTESTERRARSRMNPR